MKKAFALMLVGAIVLSGCASTGTTTSSKQGAKKGAIIGGLLGAARAIVLGGDTEDILTQAAVGAAAGAAVGYAIGKAKERRMASRDEAAAKYAYHSNQGDFLAIESFTVEPASLSPGTEAQVTVVYTVLTPSPTSSVELAHSNKLFYDDEEVMDFGTEPLAVDQGGGTMEAVYPISIPADAPAGTYSLASSLSVPGTSASDSQSANIHVVS